MPLYTAYPSEKLSPFIRKYWGIESCFPPGEEHVQRIVPNGLMELMFFLEGKPSTMNDNRSFTENSIITGQQSSYYDLKIEGNFSLISVIFHPHSLPLFFNFPSNEFFNHAIPLRSLLKDEVNEVEGKLQEANTMQERTELLEAFLLKRLVKSKIKYHFERIQNSLELINKNKGLVNIDYLASRACLSRKQYERIFTEFIGSSPKQFLRVVRFQNALNQKFMSSDMSLTSLSYLCGYYDQSHMTGDFRKLSGMSPKEYFYDSEPYSDYFQ